MDDRTFDNYTLLCNRCGYVIEGLFKEDPCPECGCPIAQSLPTERPGTPWQTKNSIRSMIATWLHVILRPSRTIDNMLLIRAASGGLAATTPFVASVLAIFFFSVIASFTVRHEQTWPASIALAILAIGYWPLTYLYTIIAVGRLKRKSKSTTNKIDQEVVWTIAEHASSYWAIIPFGIIAGSLFQASYVSHIGRNINSQNPVDYAITLTSIILSAGSIPLSIFLFELFVHKSKKKLRFYNRLLRPLMSTDPPQLLRKPVSENEKDS